VILWGYWLTKRTIGYLYASYAASALWIGAVLGGLALTGSPRTALIVAIGLAIALPFGFRRDKRRMERKSKLV
jgi:hypothetical protein